MSAIPKFISPQEYLALERASEIRHQYYRGEMFAMSGASLAHNTINFNFSRVVGNQLVDCPCRVFVNDMRVKVSASGLYTYPDMLAVCGELAFEDSHVDTLLNPTLISEVLSE